MRILFVLVAVSFWAWIAFIITHAAIEAWNEVQVGKKEARRMRKGAIERELEDMKQALASAGDNAGSDYSPALVHYPVVSAE